MLISSSLPMLFLVRIKKAKVIDSKMATIMEIFSILLVLVSSISF